MNAQAPDEPTVDEYGITVDQEQLDRLKKISQEDYDTVFRDVMEGMYAGCIDDSEVRTIDPSLLMEVYLLNLSIFQEDLAKAQMKFFGNETGNAFDDDLTPNQQQDELNRAVAADNHVHAA